MAAHYLCSLGSFNFARPSEKEWQVCLRTPHGNVSALFPEDQEPDVQDALPSEVLELIASRNATGYLFRSGRDKELATEAAIREHADELDREWLAAKVEAARKSLEGWERRLALHAVEPQP